MKVKHEQKRGHRYNCSSQKIKGKPCNRRLPFYFALTCISGQLWWNETWKRWGTFEEFKETGTSYCTHMHGINSVRAAVSHVKRHDEIPKGTKMRLCSNFIGCDVTITK